MQAINNTHPSLHHKGYTGCLKTAGQTGGGFSYNTKQKIYSKVFDFETL